ncbi:DUF1330 domain-containing protein [Embleya scabrispora]|uniref:DUF1330 domain-containing protein n=1 Tax=Embleya scabrispora TaxID=159449 RepID=UPI0003AA5975|nr:DUF1330 domain-containing protein [Embleya scabrispora]
MRSASTASAAEPDVRHAPDAARRATCLVDPGAGGRRPPQEGIWASSRLIVIEFPDLARITRWYESAEYRRAREIRKTALPLRMLFAEGTSE